MGSCFSRKRDIYRGPSDINLEKLNQDATDEWSDACEGDDDKCYKDLTRERCQDLKKLSSKEQINYQHCGSRRVISYHRKNGKKNISEKNRKSQTKFRIQLRKKRNQYNNLPQRFRCQVCEKMLLGKIFFFQCNHGALCESCLSLSESPKCPTCSSEVTSRRNYNLENEIKMLDRPCPNEDKGCIYILSSAKMNKHVNQCIFRLVNCPMQETNGDCSVRVKVKDLYNHFMQEHFGNIVNINDKVNLPNLLVSNRYCYMAQHDEFYFIIHLKVDTLRGVISVVTQHIGTPAMARNWVYHIKFLSADRVLCFNNICLSDSVDFASLFDHPVAVKLEIENALLFANSNEIYFQLNFNKNQDRIKVNQNVSKNDYAGRNASKSVTKRRNQDVPRNFDINTDQRNIEINEEESCLMFCLRLFC